MLSLASKINHFIAIIGEKDQNPNPKPKTIQNPKPRNSKTTENPKSRKIWYWYIPIPDFGVSIS
jgi:hypothetical protein